MSRVSFLSFLSVVFLTVLAPAIAHAQNGPAGGTLALQGGRIRRAERRRAPKPTGARPTLTAVRAAQPPAIDGRLDDAIWRTAALIDTFVQEEPIEGAPATEKTEVRVAYDNEKLYFGIYAHYADVGLRRANRSDRDKLDNDDTVTIFLEPFLDYLRGYSFAVNGYGVQRDSMIVVQNAASDAGGNTSFNALYYSGGQLVDDGWTAEIAIPIKSLRYPSRKAGEPHRWGFQVRREIKSKDESRRLVAGLAQQPEFPGSDRHADRHDRLLDRSAISSCCRRFTAVSSGRLNTTNGELHDRHREGRRRRAEVRHQLEPDVRLHLQPRLLADRVGHAADRHQPALSAPLPGAAPVLSRGPGNLQPRRHAARGRDPPDRGSALWRQAERKDRRAAHRSACSSPTTKRRERPTASSIRRTGRGRRT